MERKRTRPIAIVAPIVVAVLGISSVALAATHVRGVVTGRTTDGSLMVRTDDADIAIVLNENTKVRETSGMRSIKVDVASLIPGLRVDVEGTYQDTIRLLADQITFTRYDLKIARNIQAGLTPTNAAVVDNRALIDSNQQQNNAHFGQQQAALEQHDRMIAANDEKIVATSGTLAGRIASLDDYTVVDSLTVYFRNGQYAISSDFKSRLRDLAQKAKSVDGYSIQIEGHASAVGSEARNQSLSGQRAAAVAALLYQNGIPSTKMYSPAAMGTSEQVASNRTKDGQAENRRAVIRLLQNRGITGN
jgi:outer membrane protein OmpA-like peptidoglycan-associated protein